MLNVCVYLDMKENKQQTATLYLNAIITFMFPPFIAKLPTSTACIHLQVIIDSENKTDSPQGAALV